MIWSDFRMAVRRLVREPIFSVTALLTLALGIGANSAIFTVVNAVLLRPLPFSEPDRLVAPHAVLRGEAYDVFSAPVFLALQEHAPTLSAVGLVAATYGTFAQGDVAPEEISGAAISANYFDVLGVPPLRGRLFRAEENEPGVPLVLLSEGLWRQRFAAADDIVGRTVELNGVAREVVGVMPAAASMPPEHRYWVPMPYSAGFRNPSNVLALGYQLVARLAPGVTLAEASADVARVVELAKQEASMDNPHYSGAVRPLRDVHVGSSRAPLLVLLAAVGCVLLIVCANMANLLLAQAAARTTDFAVRRALGAAPSQLMRQVMTESLVLGLAGGMLGLLVAAWGVPAIMALLPPEIPRMPDVGIDAGVLLFTFGIALLAGLLFGLAPALQARSAALAPVLRQGGRGLVGGRGARTRSALVLAETAVAFALVIAAGLLIRSLGELRQVDPGFRADNALTYKLSFPLARYDSNDRVVLATDAIIEATRALPGVTHVGATQHLPLRGDANRITFQVEGRPAPRAGEEPTLRVGVVSPGYFDAMGIPLRRGRPFAATDNADGLPVALLNEAAAAMHFPGEDPLGRRVVMDWDPGGGNVQGVVVGVVGDVRHQGLRAGAEPAVYFPLAQVPSTYMAVVVRTAGDPRSLFRGVTAAVHDIDPRLAVSELQPLRRVVASSVATDRFVTALLATFSIMALLLAAVGIFGVISYAVARRRREIGVRLAVGANRRDVVILVVSGAMKLAVAGMLVGAVAAVAATRLLQSLLFGVRPTDAVTFAAAGLVLLAVALLASTLPALRAARVPPASVLNTD